MFVSDVIRDNIVEHFKWLESDYDKFLLHRQALVDENGDLIDVPVDNNEILKKLSGADDVLSGFTKLVFFFDDVPGYVVKVPFSGVDMYSLVEDTDEEEYEGFEEYLVDASFGSCSDYCMFEEYLYYKACDNDMEDFFAFTEKLITINGVPLYISLYCPNDRTDYIDDNVLRDDIKIEDRSVRDDVFHTCVRSNIPLGFINELIVKKGIDSVVKLCEFIDNSRIKDLHEENWGIDNYGNLKITDYAGYSE